MDLSVLEGLNDIRDICNSIEALELFNDRICNYFVRNNNAVDVKTLLLNEGGVYGIDYVVIEHDINNTGVYVFLQPDNLNNIKDILLNNNIILEGEYKTRR